VGKIWDAQNEHFRKMREDTGKTIGGKKSQGDPMIHFDEESRDGPMRGTGPVVAGPTDRVVKALESDVEPQQPDADFLRIRDSIIGGGT